jgi:hypothetical protein
MTTRAADDFEAIRARMRELNVDHNLGRPQTVPPMGDGHQSNGLYKHYGTGLDGSCEVCRPQGLKCDGSAWSRADLVPGQDYGDCC